MVITTALLIPALKQFQTSAGKITKVEHVNIVKGDIEIFEREMKKYATDEEIKIIRERSEGICSVIGVSMEDLYACYNVECAMNPFNCNVNSKGDTVAVGPIQITKVGSESIVPFEEIKSWVRSRNIKAIMLMTDYYLTTKNKNIRNVDDLYLLIFAPNSIGTKSNVVYKGNTQSYKQNSGLDGWVEENNKIIRLDKDKRITKSEISAFIKYKKQKLFQDYGTHLIY